MSKNGITGASKWALIGLFCAIALVLMAGGYWYYRHTTESIRSHQYDDLKAVADLKTGQIVRWRKERIADARQNSRAPFLRSTVIQWIKDPKNPVFKTQIKTRLELLKEAEDYQNVILTDTKGRLLLTLDPHLNQIEPETQKLVDQALVTGEVTFGDFFRCPHCNQVHLDVAAVILNQTQKPVGVLVLRTNPEDYLYALIQSWPMPSPSAETLLVRKDGGNVFFLNALRHHPDPALSLRLPLSNSEVPAVQAILGKTGKFDGLDYRGVEVLSDIRPIPNTTWFMVNKVDTKEILDKAATEFQLIGLLTLALVVLSGLGMAFIYKHQGKRNFQALYQTEQEKAIILEQARVTLYSIGDAVITTGSDGQVRQMNPVAETLTGWKEAEATGKPLSQVFRIVNEETGVEIDNPVERVIIEGMIVGLANHTLLIAKDGTEYPIADSGAPIRNEDREIIGVVLVFRDQTEERRKIKELMESEERVGKEKYLSEATLNSLPGIFYLFDDTGHFLRWNKNFEVVTGRSANEITYFHPLDLFVDEEKDQVAKKIQEVFDKGTSDVVAHLVSKDGKRTAYHFTGLRVVLDSRICLTGVGLDITELKQAEVALQESEILFRTFSEKAPLGISFIDVDGRYEYVNPAFTHIFGWDLSDFSTGRDWFNLAFPDPDYQRQVIAAWKEDLSKYKAEETRPRTYEVMSKNGDRKTVLFRPVTLFSGKQFIIYEDITERKRTEEALQRSEQLLNDTQRISMVGGWEYDLADQRMTWTNEVYRIYGVEKDYNPNDIKNDVQFYLDEDRGIIDQAFWNVVNSGKPYDLELRFNSADGEQKWIRTIGNPIFKDGKIVKVFGNIADITARKLVERLTQLRLTLWEFSAAHSLEELLQKTLDEVGKLTGSTIGFYHFVEADQKTLNLQAWSTRTITEFCKAEGKGRHYSVDQAGVWVDCVREGKPIIHNDYLSLPHRKGMPEGHAPVVRELIVPIFRLGKIVGILGIGNKSEDYTQGDIEIVSYLADVAWDITERKRSTEALALLSARQEALLSAIPDIIMEVDENKVYIWANPAGYEFFGEDVIGKEAALYFEGDQKTYQTVQPLFNGKEEVIYVESWQRRKNGEKRLLAWWCRILKDEKGNMKGALSTGRDITAQKQGEEALRDSEERYRTLVANANETILVVQNQRIKFYNPKAVELLGYTGGTAAVDSSFLTYVHPEDRAMIRERYRKRLKGEEVFPLTYSYRIIDLQGKMKWVELNSAFISWEGKPAVLVILEDITDRKKNEEKVIEGAEKLRKAVEGIIQAMAATVEVKDPYTAGHQRRVADLSRAIAREMGFSEDQIEGIHMAAMIHDLGKLSVPAEILSKPTQLTEIEFSLIKVHPQAGYDILKEINFPWPIARIVFQHHERINGSGYPLQIKGEEIIQEAKVLAVADVVEAIASHRPYRPALGIEKALEEIEQQKGILYDSEVVAVCLRLFREKGYTLT